MRAKLVAFIETEREVGIANVNGEKHGYDSAEEIKGGVERSEIKTFNVSNGIR
jgi:hypothetical protein